MERPRISNGAIVTSGGGVSLIANSPAAGDGRSGSGSVAINAAIDAGAGNVAIVVDGGTGAVELAADITTSGGFVQLTGPTTELDREKRGPGMDLVVTTGAQRGQVLLGVLTALHVFLDVVQFQVARVGGIPEVMVPAAPLAGVVIATKDLASH